MNGFKNFSINKKNNGWTRFLIGGIIILCILFILNIFVSPIKNFFYALSSPIQKTFWTAGESSSNFCNSLFNGGAISQENENLKSENQKLLAQVASLQSIEQGNRAQSEVSVSCQNTGFNLAMAGIVGLDDQDILSINKGSADGIAVGMPVINQQNVLFGKVFKVYKNFSKVMLISNKNSIVNVKKQQSQDCTDPEIDGVVKGNGGLSAYLDSIQIQDNINQGDVLVTSSLDKTFPKDLLIGKIDKVVKDDQKPFQQAQINLSFDVKKIDNLFVITNYKQND